MTDLTTRTAVEVPQSVTPERRLRHRRHRQDHGANFGEFRNSGAQAVQRRSVRCRGVEALRVAFSEPASRGDRGWLRPRSTQLRSRWVRSRG
jgi:hypothetical protein